jgi:F-type H+-transporting ATPase subunit epsilon
MSRPLHVKIILPEASVPPRVIQGLDVPAADGRLTVLAGHQPLVAALVPGTAIVSTVDGMRESWRLSAGALQMEGDTAILLVTEATLVENVAAI